MLNKREDSNLEESPTANTYLLPEETLAGIEGLSVVLRRIYQRMKSEGYDIIEGKVVRVKNHEKRK